MAAWFRPRSRRAGRVPFLAAWLVVVCHIPVVMSMSENSRGQSTMFSEARAYERFMGRWSRQLAPAFAKFSGVRDGDAVLDVGSGTGSLALAIASGSKTGRVVGVDPSEGYVAYAASQTRDARVSFEAGDAQQLRFSDAEFDRTVSLLVMNFIPNAQKALLEMIRVTKPGGTVAAAVWDYSEGMEMLRVFWDEAVLLDPTSDKKDERHMPLCRKGELGAMWRHAGLTEVQEEELTIEMRFPSFDEYWRPFLEGQGPAGSFATALPRDKREELARRLRARLLSGGKDAPIVMKARAWAVKGTVPQAPR